jgi:hypothetical protein
MIKNEVAQYSIQIAFIHQQPLTEAFLTKLVSDF